MRIIDAHNHPDFCNYGFDAFIKNMDEAGIEKTCLLSWEAPRNENDAAYLALTPCPIDDSVPIPFGLCLEYRDKAPDRFILGYAPDPRQPGAMSKMESAIKTYGVKVCGEVKFRMMYDNPDAIDLFRMCGEYGVPVILHFDYPEANLAKTPHPRRHWWYGGDIDTLERVLQKCPDTKFLGHAPGFWAHISDDNLGETMAYPLGPVVPGGKLEKFLDKYSNLYCDCSASSCLCAMSRDKEYTNNLILKHPDRFVYARDDFHNKHQVFFDTLGLPEDVLEMVYHKNIETLIGE
ncbi:MAG: amidohydrolase family protein [Clostridia bacterium]|nr:amidohydrolase family protein [Clostridia bacterium]